MLKVIKPIASILLVIVLVTGCQEPVETQNTPVYETVDSELCSVYSVAKIRIVGLTSFLPEIYGLDQAELEVYVDMLDSFDSRIKAAGIFRFELYEYVPRVSNPKGTRIYLWPDLDIRNPVDNNRHWRDYLRSYQFNLTMTSRPKKSATYILEVTCMSPAGKRLTNTFQIEYKK